MKIQPTPDSASFSLPGDVTPLFHIDPRTPPLERDIEESTQRASVLMQEAQAIGRIEEHAPDTVDYFALKAFLITACILIIHITQRAMPVSWWTYQDVVQALYYLPCLVAAMTFGLRGAALASGLACILTIWHVTVAMGGDFFGACLCRTGHILLLLGITLGAGWLADQSHLARRRAEGACNRLQNASRLLMETTARLHDSMAQLRQATMHRVAAEQQLRRSERLNAMGKLTAGLAHEIRNPLASIKGSAEILRDRVTGDPTIREFVDIMVQETDRLNQVLTRFLNFARDGREETGTAALPEIIAEVEALLRRPMTKADVRFEQDIAPNLPPVQMSPVDLRQVVLNLMLNATQVLHTWPGKRIIRITASVMPSSRRTHHLDPDDGPAEDIRLIVEDSGPGILSDVVDRIFDPFFTTRDDGTGLGLAIVDRMVREAGGQITVIACGREQSGEQRLGGAAMIIDLCAAAPPEPHAAS